MELFGTEMTNERGVCKHCGTEGLLAELRVYNRAPGGVARCRKCSGVALVIVDVRGEPRITMDGYELQSGMEPLA
jgi:hypothetical protein